MVISRASERTRPDKRPARAPNTSHASGRSQVCGGGGGCGGLSVARRVGRFGATPPICPTAAAQAARRTWLTLRRPPHLLWRRFGTEQTRTADLRSADSSRPPDDAAAAFGTTHSSEATGSKPVGQSQACNYDNCSRRRQQVGARCRRRLLITRAASETMCVQHKNTRFAGRPAGVLVCLALLLALSLFGGGGGGDVLSAVCRSASVRQRAAVRRAAAAVARHARRRVRSGVARAPPPD